MKITFTIAAFALALCAYATAALARPVSYPGGWTVMQMNDGDSNSLHIHYSPTAKYSVGYKGEYWRDEDWQFHGVQLNYLAKRWNQPHSQANLYFKTAAGVALADGESQESGFGGVAFDWESRRFFTSYENRGVYAGDIDRFFTQKARIGVAPYVGEYGDLHTWLMLQVDHNPAKADEVTFTPLVRMFKGNFLTEAGMSDKGKVLFNAVIRF